MDMIFLVCNYFYYCMRVICIRNIFIVFNFFELDQYVLDFVLEVYFE